MWSWYIPNKWQEGFILNSSVTLLKCCVLYSSSTVVKSSQRNLQDIINGPSISVIHIWSYTLFRPFQLYTFDLIYCSVHFSYTHLILFTVPSISVIHIWSYTVFRPFQLYPFDLIQCSVHFSYIHLILFTVLSISVIHIWSYTLFRPFQLYTVDLIQCSVHFNYTHLI